MNNIYLNMLLCGVQFCVYEANLVVGVWMNLYRVDIQQHY